MWAQAPQGEDVQRAATEDASAATEDASAATSSVVRWLERELGGSVVRIERQARWRPIWIVDLERDGVCAELMVRGARTDTALAFPLEHEMRFQDLLHRHQIPVPQVHGWIDEQTAYVMERMPGRPDFADSTPSERDTVVDEYIQVLARLHQLDMGPFIDAGIERADSQGESGWVGMSRFEALYRAQKQEPDPFLEFALGWVHRHPPRSRGRETPIVWDSGQFHHHAGHLVSLMDLELGHLGDPMMDLAGWRMRDSILGFGDFDCIYDRYADLTGEAVDLDAVQLHHIAFTLTNELSFSHMLRRPTLDTDLMTNMQWCNETNLYATEAIAEYLDVELPTVEVPEAPATRAAPAYRHLVEVLRTIDAGDDYTRYQLRGAFRLARHLHRTDEIGAALLAADLDDLHRLLGHRPETWHDAETELERLVLADRDTGTHDETLLALFHRRNLRAQMLNGPEGSAMAAHKPLQPFRKRQ
jgi:aminoglycoside phosphotransferase (APT) family kinase protein